MLSNERCVDESSKSQFHYTRTQIDRYPLLDVKPLKTAEAIAWNAMYSPDGRFTLIPSGYDGQGLLVHSRTFQPLGVVKSDGFQDRQYLVYSGFNHDGSRLATFYNHGVRIYATDPFKLISTVDLGPQIFMTVGSTILWDTTSPWIAVIGYENHASENNKPLCILINVNDPSKVRALPIESRYSGWQMGNGRIWFGDTVSLRSIDVLTGKELPPSADLKNTRYAVSNDRTRIAMVVGQSIKVLKLPSMELISTWNLPSALAADNSWSSGDLLWSRGDRRLLTFGEQMLSVSDPVAGEVIISWDSEFFFPRIGSTCDIFESLFEATFESTPSERWSRLLTIGRLFHETPEAALAAERVDKMISDDSFGQAEIDAVTNDASLSELTAFLIAVRAQERQMKMNAIATQLHEVKEKTAEERRAVARAVEDPLIRGYMQKRLESTFAEEKAREEADRAEEAATVFPVYHAKAGRPAEQYKAMLEKIQAGTLDKQFLGHLQYRLGQYEAALATLTAATDPTRIDSRVPSFVDLGFMALAQFRLGRVEEATKTFNLFDKAIESADIRSRIRHEQLWVEVAAYVGPDPSYLEEFDYSALNEFAYLTCDFPDQPKIDYETALRLTKLTVKQGSHPHYLNTLAMAEFRLGRFEESVATFKKSHAAWKDPNVFHWAFRSMAEYKAGHTADAWKSLEQMRQSPVYGEVDPFVRAEALKMLNPASTQPSTQISR